MKDPTLLSLLQELDNDLSWRKVELADHRLKVGSKSDHTPKQQAHLRAALAMLYAHWEGYIKRASELYVMHVSLQRLSHADLSIPFLAQAFRRVISPASSSKRIAAHQQAVRFIIEELQRQSSLTSSNVVSARSNLTSSVFKEILLTLGLDYTPYASKEKLVDESLVERRNHIAHGEYLIVSAEEYHSVSGAVIDMLDQYKDQVYSAAQARRYRREIS